jgi:hypothetical protein
MSPARADYQMNNRGLPDLQQQRITRSPTTADYQISSKSGLPDLQQQRIIISPARADYHINNSGLLGYRAQPLPLL